MGLADLLDDKLGNPVTSRDGETLIRVGVDQVDQDLAAVARVHRARRIQHGDAVPGGEARTRVDEGGKPRGQRDGHTGRNQRTLSRSEEHRLSGIQVGAGITRVGVPRHRQIGVGTHDQHCDPGGIGHPDRPPAAVPPRAPGAPLRQRTRDTPAGP